MKLNKIYCAYFSPGGTTRQVTTGIAAAFSDYPVEEIDLTDYDARKKTYSFGESDLLILGAPAYAGRIPAPMAEALSRFHGVNTPTVYAATYGNRAVDDTLMELRMCTSENGFTPVAAGTFVCQHTFLPELAAGRPDGEDMDIIHKMSGELRERLRLAVIYDMKPIEFPGSFPYTKPPMGIFPFEVETNDFCFYCMLCRDACPVRAIHADNPKSIDHTVCLRCGSCIRVCPAQAKSFSENAFAALQEKLAPLCGVRREPWYVIG